MQLIYIDLTYVQVLTGTGGIFLNKDYDIYSWVEKGWITSLWEFMSKVKLTFSYPSAWLPPLQRQEDTFLMDCFNCLKLPHKELEELNHYRLYPQVLTLFISLQPMVSIYCQVRETALKTAQESAA